MRQRSKVARLRTPTFLLLPVFLVILVVFLVLYFTKTGPFFVPGKIIYDSSLTDYEKQQISALFPDDLVLKNDLVISASESLEHPEVTENDFLIGIYVPVTDFYSTVDNFDFSLDDLPGTPVSSSDAISDVKSTGDTTSSASSSNQNTTSSVASLISSGAAFGENIYFIPISSLKNSVKLLSLNGNYYLDNFSSGAVYRKISFASQDFAEEIAPHLADSDLLHQNFPSSNTVLTFAQTGVTALSRGMNKKLTSVGDVNYFSAKIAGFLSGFDLTHTSNESSFSDFASSKNICSNPAFKNTLHLIGLDIVELTGNHNEDCGDEAASSTIDFYNENNIQTVGGGKTAVDAAKPLQISEKGSHLTFLAYNLSTGGATTDDTPGANQYSEENAASEITAAKSRGDFIIVDIQYYECSAYVSETEDETCDFANSAAGDQVGFFRHLIDLGANLVVGTAAHQPQTYEIYNNGVIYYGLGNLFFDQSWWPGTSRSLVLGNYYYNSELLQTKISVTSYNENYQPTLADAETKNYLLARLAKNRPRDALDSVQASGLESLVEAEVEKYHN